MKIRPPAKFSQQWWVLITIATTVFILLVASSLDWFGFEFDIYAILFILSASAIFDFFLATSMEAVSPTKITVGPGEKQSSDSDLTETALVISGFEKDSDGRVSIRGEVWNARWTSGAVVEIPPDREVAILGRDGLTLVVGALTHDT
jgi:membrane protein implicated in regulation of membrane protease activity